MAAITPLTNPSSGVLVALWNLTTADDEGDELALPYHNDICVHVYGTLDGATIAFEGSNLPGAADTEWTPIHLIDGTLASFTVESIGQLLEAPYKIRATSTGGGGSSSVIVLVKANRAR